MAILMKADFKYFRAGKIVDPEPDLAAWLISRNYADPAPALPETPAAEAVEAPVKPPAKKGKK